MTSSGPRRGDRDLVGAALAEISLNNPQYLVPAVLGAIDTDWYLDKELAMAKAVVQHAEDDERLTPQVRKALLAPIVGGIAAILDSTIATLALHTL
jgi:hypothetical protein